MPLSVAGNSAEVRCRTERSTMSDAGKVECDRSKLKQH